MPLDSKVWMTEAQRLALTTVKKYKWMLVIDSDTGVLYQLVSAPNVTPAIWKPILTDISNENDIPNGIEQWEPDHVTLQQDGTYLLGYQFGNIVWLKVNNQYLLYICILEYEDEGISYSPDTNTTNWKQIGSNNLAHLQNTDIHLGKYTTTINLTTGHPDMIRYDERDKILNLDFSQNRDKYNNIIINTDSALEINKIIYNYNYKSTIVFNNVSLVEIDFKIIINDINYNEGNIFIEGGNKQITLNNNKSFIELDFINNILCLVNYSKIGEEIQEIPEGIELWTNSHTYYIGNTEYNGYILDSKVYYTISEKIDYLDVY